MSAPFVYRASLLAAALALAGCQSAPDNNAPVAADLNSATPAIATQAGKVQELLSQMERQKAVIETEKTKLTALEQQLAGARQNLEGLKKEVRATP